MLEYILAISVLVNFVLIIACVILKRSRDWHEQMWFKMANARNRERMMKYHAKSED